MGKEYEYRVAALGDIDTIVEFWSESAQFHENLEPRLQYVSNAQESMKKYFTDQLQKDTFVMFIARTGDEDVGFVEAQVIEKGPIHVLRKRGYVGALYVRAPNRRDGVGYNLWKLVCDWFSKQKVTKFQLAVAVMNPEAIDFWHKIGFKEIFLQMEHEVD